jgi:hypothetical protein
VECPKATTTCSGLWRNQLANSLTRRRMQSMLSALWNTLWQTQCNSCVNTRTWPQGRGAGAGQTNWHVAY